MHVCKRHGVHRRHAFFTLVLVAFPMIRGYCHGSHQLTHAVDGRAEQEMTPRANTNPQDCGLWELVKISGRKKCITFVFLFRLVL